MTQITRVAWASEAGLKKPARCCRAVCCEAPRKWDWGKQWSPSLAEEHGASPARRTTSTRTSRASCASSPRRSVRLQLFPGTYTGKSFSHVASSSSSSRWLQERQSIIKYWLDNLRAKQGEVLHNISFLEGQPISKWSELKAPLSSAGRGVCD